jgi:hypothetical protein
MMTMDGARELGVAARTTASTVLAGSPRVAPRQLVPVVLSATRREAPGAMMWVGGLRVVDRAIRQLARLRDVAVVIADDGSVRLPRRLPANVETRSIEGDPEAAVERLRVELGAEAVVVRADTVWLQPARFDRGTQVVDSASRRAADAVVFRDAQRDTVGLVDRAFNQKIASMLTRLLLLRLPFAPAFVTLVAGFVGLYGAMLVADGTWQGAVVGFAILEAHAILDGCAGELGRVRLHQTVLGAWLDTVVGDFVNVVMILAVGLGLWSRGGTYLDMKLAAVAAGLTLFYIAVAYRELMRQGEGDVSKLRWWFTYGQQLKSFRGAGSRSIKAVILLGRRDMVVLVAIALAYFDQLPIVLLYLLIVAMVRAAGALGQLLAPDWRTRPPA